MLAGSFKKRKRSRLERDLLFLPHPCNEVSIRFRSYKISSLILSGLQFVERNGTLYAEASTNFPGIFVLVQH